MDKQPITLIDLMVELSAAGGSETEVVAAVMDLFETGRVSFARPFSVATS